MEETKNARCALATIFEELPKLRYALVLGDGPYLVMRQPRRLVLAAEGKTLLMEWIPGSQNLGYPDQTEQWRISDNQAEIQSAMVSRAVFAMDAVRTAEKVYDLLRAIGLDGVYEALRRRAIDAAIARIDRDLVPLVATHPEISPAEAVARLQLPSLAEEPSVESEPDANDDDDADPYF